MTIVPFVVAENSVGMGRAGLVFLAILVVSPLYSLIHLIAWLGMKFEEGDVGPRRATQDADAVDSGSTIDRTEDVGAQDDSAVSTAQPIASCSYMSSSQSRIDAP